MRRVAPEVCRGSLEGAPELAEIRARATRGNQHALEPRLGGVHGSTQGVVSQRALLVESLALLELAGTRGVFRFQPEQLRARHRGQLRALSVQRFEARAGSGDATEIEIGVGQIEQRIAGGVDPPRAPAHVDGGLEVIHGAGDVAGHLQQAGQVELRGGECARVAGALGGRYGARVRRLGLVGLIVSLQRKPE